MDSNAADTLMEYLPPVGWQDVATKQDLTHLEQRIEQRIEHTTELLEHRSKLLEQRMEAIEHRLLAAIANLRADVFDAMRKQTLAMMFGMIGAVTSVVALPPLIDKIP